MIQMVVQEIRRLSQEVGLTDREIANRLGLSMDTIRRVRKANSIPRANLANRVDKRYTCQRCGKVVAIARKERRRKYCPECRPTVAAQNAARELDRRRVRMARKDEPERASLG